MNSRQLGQRGTCKEGMWEGGAKGCRPKGRRAESASPGALALNVSPPRCLPLLPAAMLPVLPGRLYGHLLRQASLSLQLGSQSLCLYAPSPRGRLLRPLKSG